MRATTALVLLLALLGAPASAADDPEALLRRALDQYAEGSFEASIRTLLRAEKLATDVKVRGRIRLYLGVNRAVLGQTAGAREAFAAALSDDPDLSLDPRRFKKTVLRLFEEEKARRAAQPTPQPTPQPPRVDEPGATQQSAPSTAPAASRPGGDGPPKPPLLRPGTRRWQASLVIGGSFGVRGAVHVTGIDAFGVTVNEDVGFPHGFTLVEEIAVHFAARSAGPALGFTLTESFGSFRNAAGGYFEQAAASFSAISVQPGLRFFWDIQLGSKALYLSPSIQVAYAYWHLGGSGAAADTDATLHAVSAQPALELKLLLADRALIFLRPVAVEVLTILSSSGFDPTVYALDQVVVRYGVQLGVGVTF